MQRDMLFFDVPEIAPIDKTVGVGTGRFLGDVANGMRRAELVKRWRDGLYPDLNEALAKEAIQFNNPLDQGRV